MAVTKTSAAITQVTSTTQSPTIACAAALGGALCVKHVNGTATPSVAAVIQVQVQTSAATRWYNYGGAYTPNKTANSEQHWVLDIPDGIAAVRIDYTLPTGSTGALDAELGTVTALG